MTMVYNRDSIRVTPGAHKAIVFSILPGAIRGVTRVLGRVAFFIWGNGYGKRKNVLR